MVNAVGGRRRRDNPAAIGPLTAISLGRRAELSASVGFGNREKLE